ncbi:MAG: hypothetical protein HC932_04825 [Thermales bacterium]|nr:hypothetical protein [Thermales bacterium]
MAFGLLLSGVGIITASNNIVVEAQYGSYEQCEKFTDPVKKEKCNARIQAKIDKRTEKLFDQAQKQILKVIVKGSNNLNAAILSILNVLYWEIWNLINVIFPLA